MPIKIFKKKKKHYMQNQTRENISVPAREILSGGTGVEANRIQKDTGEHFRLMETPYILGCFSD